MLAPLALFSALSAVALVAADEIMTTANLTTQLSYQPVQNWLMTRNGHCGSVDRYTQTLGANATFYFSGARAPRVCRDLRPQRVIQAPDYLSVSGGEATQAWSALRLTTSLPSLWISGHKCQSAGRPLSTGSRRASTSWSSPCSTRGTMRRGALRHHRFISTTSRTSCSPRSLPCASDPGGRTGSGRREYRLRLPLPACLRHTIPTSARSLEVS